jgi:hypothetical protein
LDPDRALAICKAIHEQLGQHSQTIRREWTLALAMHNKPSRRSITYDAVQDCLDRIQRGQTMHVIGSVGTIRVDSRTGKVVRGSNIVGVKQVQLP